MPERSFWNTNRGFAMVQNMDEFSSLEILNSTIIIFYSTPAHSKVLVCNPVSFDCCAVPIASITVDNSKFFYLSITVDIFVYIVNRGYFCVREMH